MILNLTRRCKFIFLTTLDLLFTAVIATNTSDNLFVEPFAEYDTSPTRGLFESRLRFDPNVMDNHNIATTTELYSSSLNRTIGSLIKIIGPVTEKSRIKSECFIPFRRANSMESTRLSYKTVLFPIRAVNDEDGHELLKLVLANTDNCKYTYALNLTLPSKNIFFYTNDSADDDSFTIVMHDTNLCRGYTWCRLFFNPFYYKFQPLNFDFPSNQIRRNPDAIIFDGNLIVAYLQDDTDTYRIHLYTVTNYFGPAEYKELLTIENYGMGWQDRYEVASSSLSHCWRTKQNTDEDKMIHCAVFREDGSMEFNETVVYSEIKSLRQVQSVPNGLTLINHLGPCSAKICPAVRTTVITKKSKCTNDNNNRCYNTVQTNYSIEIKDREYVNFLCRSFIFAFRFFKVNESDNSLQHICTGFGFFPLQNFVGK